MSSDGSPPEWSERLQAVVDETVNRFMASTANLQRLLAAASAPGSSPELLASELPRWSTEHGADGYRRLLEVSTRFTARSMRLVSRYRDEYLRELLPASRLEEAGIAASVPPPPDSVQAADWTTWYQLYSAWVADQQAWSARLYRILLDEVASGGVRAEDVQATARAFMQRRLPDYLVDMARLNAELVSDLLSLADSSLAGLSESLLERQDGDGGELSLDVHGVAGSTAQARLVVENTRADHATVRCLVTPADGFDLVTAPTEFGLAPGETRAVTVRVGLPATPIEDPQDAGTLVIRGQGESDLVVHVRVTARPSEDAQPPPRDPGPGGEGATGD